MAIHPTARIDPTAEIDSSASIGANVEIGPGCVVGPDCELMAGAILGPRVRMGRENRVHAYAILGEEPQFLGFDPKTASGVLIGDKNEFREMCTVHRGLKDGADTVIGNENFLMVHSHVAHDCQLANNIVLANCALLAGHVEVHDRAFISGHCAVHQYCRIGRMAMIGGMTGIGKDMPPFMTARGNFSFLVGVNTVGLRRGGVGPESRLQIKNAFRSLFRLNIPLHAAVESLRAEYREQSREMCPELEELLAFCEGDSKRGILTATRSKVGQGLEKEATEGEDQ